MAWEDKKFLWKVKFAKRFSISNCYHTGEFEIHIIENLGLLSGVCRWIVAKIFEKQSHPFLTKVVFNSLMLHTNMTFTMWIAQEEWNITRSELWDNSTNLSKFTTRKRSHSVINLNTRHNFPDDQALSLLSPCHLCRQTAQ